MESAICMNNDLYEIIKRANEALGKKKQTPRKKHKKPKAEQDWIYLLHHMHPPKKEEDMETLHHCQLSEKKGLKGKKFDQRHVKDDKVFQHALDIKEKEVDSAPKVVYCHLNNEYTIGIKEINDKKWAIFTGMVSLKETKWSDQDKGMIK